jgi:hypothetical protein
MTRALTILAAVAALAVSAAPALASTGGDDSPTESVSYSVKAPTPRTPMASARLSKKPSLHTFSGDAYVNEMG